VLETSLGDLVIDLFTDKRPKACFNFLKLCKIKYYNYHLFFEIKKDYTARTGDPTNTGNGGESIYWFDESFEPRKKYFSSEHDAFLRHTKVGQVSMINNGRHKHGSQFFITLASNLDYLDKQGHTIFGQVVEGLDVLEVFNKTLLDDKDCPYKDICISHTVILDDPFKDPPFLKRLVRKSSPEIPEYLYNSKRVGIYDDLNADEGKSIEELEAEQEAKDAQEKAIVLELLGDLPSADAKPPENVLFICRLNPITEEEDLERIFSRFGKVNSAKIIKDPKTGQSLQYGFIEFDKKEDCERAYLKMNNVLLDDRRIHVDFSQSVVKVKNENKNQHRR